MSAIVAQAISDIPSATSTTDITSIKNAAVLSIYKQQANETLAEAAGDGPSNAVQEIRDKAIEDVNSATTVEDVEDIRDQGVEDIIAQQLKELKDEYLATLENGKHIPEIVFSDGSIKTEFTVFGNGEVVDLTRLWIVIAVVVVAAIIFVVLKTRKKNENENA